MSIFYRLVQMIRWLLLLGFNSVYFYDTRNRPLFYLKNNNDDYQNNYHKQYTECYIFIKDKFNYFRYKMI